MAKLLTLICFYLALNGSVTGSTVTVVNSDGKPVKDAHIYFVHKEKKIYVNAKSDKKGLAELKAIDKHSVTVFCAHLSYAAYRKESHLPDKPLVIKLIPKKSTGSVILPEGKGYVPGLIGRLNPKRDTSNRLYMYATNIALNGGKQQPVYFRLNKPISAEDRDGNRFELVVIDIIGKTVLIEFKKKRKKK